MKRHLNSPGINSFGNNAVGLHLEYLFLEIKIDNFPQWFEVAGQYTLLNICGTSLSCFLYVKISRSIFLQERRD